MNTSTCRLSLLLIVVICAPAVAQIDASLEDNLCVMCHSTKDLWDEEKMHLFVPIESLANDVHWSQGIRCHDCHGGNSETFEVREAHATDDGFRKIETPADIPNFCGHCHADADTMRKYKPDAELDDAKLSVIQRFLGSAHGQHLQNVGGEEAADCTSCHGKHGMLPTSDPQSASHPSQLANTCGTCHAPQHDALLIDVHSKAGPKDAQGVGTVLSCSECHGRDVHGLLAVSDRNSPVFVNNQVEGCGACHEKEKLTYLSSVHGNGLINSGLLSTAACANCHGAHGVFKADNEASLLHATKVAGTCATCHRFIEERLATSVHGSGNGPGGATEKVAPGGKIKRKPSCTDCHQNHDIANPRTALFQKTMPHRCGDCHQDLLRQYAISVHGELTELGYGPAAKCSDCHGSHDILPMDDTRARMTLANRAVTCGKCHSGATGSFLNFDPHADHRDPARSPLLYGIYMVLMTILLSTIGFFGLHSVLWFVRGLIDVFRHGREHSWKPGAIAYVRFGPFHRVSHTLLMSSFLGLALTGLPLKYSQTAWAQATATALGGFTSTSVWHRIFGLVNIGCLIVYMILLVVRFVSARRRGKPVKQILFGPDSPVPSWRDVKDFFAMFRWFFGLGKKPTFERWAYWEKVDFWGASADIVIIGFTGLILWFPYFFCSFLPGETLNIAKVIHSTQALLATGFVFAIHFFATHLRPEKFPMDMVMLTGMVSEEELEEERPEMLERYRREGRLEAMQTTIPPRTSLLRLAAGGAIGLIIGLALLIGIIIGIAGG